MPIFMDRHDVSASVTAESVALMHHEDLKIQDRFGCKGLTYWFDEERHTAFCLIEAPDVAAIELMHFQAHGNIPNRIIQIDASIIESFLGEIQDPAKAGAPDIIRNSAFRVIMVVFIKNTTFPNPPEDIQLLLKKIQQKITDVPGRHEGNMVKFSDGYYLISFTSASDAVHAASEILSDVKKMIDSQDNIEIKIGLSAGDPVTDKPSLFEEAIRLAERMCDMVDRNMIISSQVRMLCETEHAAISAPGEERIFLTSEDEEFILLFMDYMDANWDNINLKIDDFCQPLHCSKSHLYRKMIALAGCPLHHFIKNYRLEEAMKLLKRKEGNIAEIAFETGFSSPSYFSKCFQKKYGCIPSRFMLQN